MAMGGKLDSRAMPRSPGGRGGLTAVLLLVLALAAAGCGSGGSNPSQEKPATSTQAPPTPDQEIATIVKAISKDVRQRPRVPAPPASPPDHLVKVDVVKGKGKPARTGQKVTVQYVGVAWSTGQEFDASWNRHKPFSFRLGQGQVIKGWDKGVVGMRPGGRRLLVIPSALGYGAQGSPPAIGPNETLIFVVDLK
jgi:peptidylprolyl isomerase